MSKRVASLTGAALRLEALREEGRAELVDLLESLPGNKCLVLESHIGRLLNHVIPEGSKVCFVCCWPPRHSICRKTAQVEGHKNIRGGVYGLLLVNHTTPEGCYICLVCLLANHVVAEEGSKVRSLCCCVKLLHGKGVKRTTPDRAYHAGLGIQSRIGCAYSSSFRHSDPVKSCVCACVRACSPPVLFAGTLVLARRRVDVRERTHAQTPDLPCIHRICRATPDDPATNTNPIWWPLAFCLPFV